MPGIRPRLDCPSPSFGRRAFLVGAGAGPAGCWRAASAFRRSLAPRRRAARATRSCCARSPRRSRRGSASCWCSRPITRRARSRTRSRCSSAPTSARCSRPASAPSSSSSALGMLSEQGREAFAGTLAVEGRLDGCVLALYGEPETGRAQAVLMGGHVMLRGGGESAEGAAFGGGLAYGHQIGNHRWRVEGNSFAPHGDAANRLVREPRARGACARHPALASARARAPGAARGRALPRRARRLALRAARRRRPPGCSTPSSRAIRKPRARGRSPASRATAGAKRCTSRSTRSHGFYRGHARVGDARARGARAARRPLLAGVAHRGPRHDRALQGPSARARLRPGGARPRAREFRRRRSARLATSIEGERLRRVLEGALRRATGEPLAFHADEIPGRFCPGEITTGLAYSLDPYRNHVVGGVDRGPRDERCAARAPRRGGRRDRAGAALPGGEHAVLRGGRRRSSASRRASSGAICCCATRSWRTCAQAASRTRTPEVRARAPQVATAITRASIQASPAACQRHARDQRDLEDLEAEARRPRQPAQALAVPAQEDRDREHRRGHVEREVVAADEQARDRVDRRHAGGAGRRRSPAAAPAAKRRARASARSAAPACRRTRAARPRRRRCRGRAARASRAGSVRPREARAARTRAGSALSASRAPPLAKLAPDEVRRAASRRGRHRIATRSCVGSGERRDADSAASRAAAARFVQRFGRSSARARPTSSAAPASAPTAKATSAACAGAALRRRRIRLRLRRSRARAARARAAAVAGPGRGAARRRARARLRRRRRTARAVRSRETASQGRRRSRAGTPASVQAAITAALASQTSASATRPGAIAGGGRGRSASGRSRRGHAVRAYSRGLSGRAASALQPAVSRIHPDGGSCATRSPGRAPGLRPRGPSFRAATCRSGHRTFGSAEESRFHASRNPDPACWLLLGVICRWRRPRPRRRPSPASRS